MKITAIHAREVLDSRGNPTVEAEVHLIDGSWGRATVPSGASVGSHEAHELRDGDLKRYRGLGVLRAVENVNHIIAPDLVGLDIENQRLLDNRLIKLDGTTNKERLGANAILACSIALLKAAASTVHMPVYQYLGGTQVNTMPVPLMNIINGGRHAKDSTDFQEFMIAPVNAESFHQAMQIGLEVYHSLKSLIQSKGISTTVGDEGGFGLPGYSNEQALQLLVEAIEKARYEPGRDVQLALDVASDEFYANGQFEMKREKKVFTPEQMQQYIAGLTAKFPIFSVEDPLQEDDWLGYQQFTSDHGNKLQIVGDDLFATNMERLRKGVAEGCANAILIKLNQIGTVTETIDVINMAKQSHYSCVISHRSGDTADPFIADLAVAVAAGQIKTGSPARGERTSKYNQLLRIEEWLDGQATYANFG